MGTKASGFLAWGIGYLILGVALLNGCAQAPGAVNTVGSSLGQAVATTAGAAEAVRTGVIQAVGQREVKTTQKFYVGKLRPIAVIKNDSEPATAGVIPAPQDTGL